MIQDIRTAQFVIVGLIVLLIIAFLIILRKSGRRNIYNGKDDSSRDSVPRDVHRKVFEEKNEYYDKLREIQPAYNELQDKYENACVEIGNLKRRIDELTRDNNELNALYSNNADSDNLRGSNEVHNTEFTYPHVDEMSKEPIGAIITKYASFPRSVDSAIYFSDLTDKLADDSYFELKISNETGKATFKPLDFMKIRNYDPAMAAIQTDGVKPNIASSVVGVEMGEAYLEGNDWVIKKLAKVKLT